MSCGTSLGWRQVKYLEEAGENLFTFTRLPESQWKSARTTNAIEFLNEEFKRASKTQAVLPCAPSVPESASADHGR